MTLDIRGGIKNTAINDNDYVVIEEMLSNAIDSYLIRLNEEPSAPQFFVRFSINTISTSLLDDVFDIEIACTDNGAGFGDEQVKAFTTKDSTYKDQLEIVGIGKCKGAGRIQFFHHFSKFCIDSIFKKNGKLIRRVLFVDAATREVSKESFREELVSDLELSTTIKVGNRRIGVSSALHAPDLSHEDLKIFSATSVAAHLYRSFLQRFIILKGLIGNFEVQVTSTFGQLIEQESIQGNDLPAPVESCVLPLICAHGKDSRQNSQLSITRYSFSEREFPAFQNEVALCANSAVVKGLTRHYLRSADRKRAINGNFELVLVESEFLEEKVNQQRDGFDIPEVCGETVSLNGDFSMEDVVGSLEDYVYGIFTPVGFDRNVLVRATEEKFGITSQMLEAASIKIHYGDTEENIAKRVLKKLQDDIVGDTSKIYRVKDELLQLDPRGLDFRKKVSELSWKYASTIKKMDMVNLSQLIVRRSAMVEVLRYAVNKLLVCQNVEDGRRNEHEKIVHNIFFPTGKDSHETSEHDIWLLNEEYQYFEYISSDKALSSLKWIDGERLFDDGVDESLQQLFAENNKEHAAKRPDIALFNEEGAAIIIEFKAPGVELQDHINDLVQYARLLASKSNGRIKKFYGYLIGDTLNHSRMPTGWTRFPNAKGYFQTGHLEDPESGRRYGELYSELLFYNQFIDRAEIRLKVYKDKLKLQID